MVDTGAVARPGRKEGAFDPEAPAHRVAFARGLRELRQECGGPSYRILGALSHCGVGSLSEAASARRLPTWETTRGYVTGCLRHAGRDREIPQALREWRSRWDEAGRQERAHREPPEPVPPVPPVSPALTVSPGLPDEVERPRARQRAAGVALVVLLALSLLGGGAVPPLPRMTGLYNVVVTPFASSGAAERSRLPDALQHTLTRELRAWSEGVPAVQLRGPTGVRAADGPDRVAALRAIADRHSADIVVAGRVDAAGDRVTITVELFLAERILAETPELVGVHEISVTEPADVLDRNPAINEQLAADTLDYVAGVVAFLRGLGDYATDDFTGAEAQFRTSAARFTATGQRTVRMETVHLMLGNTIGRGAPDRFAAAADFYRRALAANPGYVRARVGLAEAERVASGCGDRPALERAVDGYRAALTAGTDAGDLDPTLAALKARLGLGLAYQCLTLAGGGDHWAAAQAAFEAVLAGYAAPPAAPRQRLPLAAEARAGQALTAYLTADKPETAARYGGYPAAVDAYEEALALLARVDVVRPTHVRRELVLLRNLAAVHERMGAPDRAAEVEDRIGRAEARLESTLRSGGAR
ncbi:hypothetical protein [Asanoa siamensis]|uniref:Tetratricopeptide repeat protein n=1 Tax=Asanoa siamensis TaxID=926357 RepID=A0ABQ4CW27_9ACTN|nr:hypothetical protein [Asanoa siamensis]GIF75468.1 hypothetical protein Asi02nite_49860 [Asanoa siamensis]